jgi:hypothetical protein
MTLMYDPSIDQVKQLAATGQQLVVGAQNLRDRRAALLLHQAALTIASMAAYDNECRATYEPLLGFSQTWSKTQRAEAWDRVNLFVRVHGIYPILQQSLPALEGFVGHLRKEQRDAAERLVEAATGYKALMLTIRFEKGKWQPSISRYLLLRGDTDQVVSHAKSIGEPLHEVGLPLLDAGRAAYGVLQNAVLRSHTRLIGWRQLVVDVSGGPSE